METKIVIYALLGIAGISATLGVFERSLIDLIDTTIQRLNTGIERFVSALETGCGWLRGQTEGIVRNVSGDMFWGAAVAAALWNLGLLVTFALAEYGLILLTLRAVGLSDQQSVLPFGAGFLTGVAFLACSIFFFEMLLELLGVGNLSGVWQRAATPVKRGLVTLCVLCLAMVVMAGAILAGLRAGAFDSVSLTGEFLGVAKRTWLAIATVEITLTVFVACGLAGWSVIRSLLHLYGVGTVILHGVLAIWALGLRLSCMAFESIGEIAKRVLAVGTAPWRMLYAWLSRYAWVRRALRLEPPQTGRPPSTPSISSEDNNEATERESQQERPYEPGDRQPHAG